MEGIVRKGILIFDFIFNKTRIKRISAVVHAYLHMGMCKRLSAVDSIMLFKRVLYITGYLQHTRTLQKISKFILAQQKIQKQNYNL